MKQDSPDGIGVGGSGVPDLTGAASATISPEHQQQIAQMLIQRMMQSRLGSSGGLTTGPEMSKPMMPLPPQEISNKGIISQGPFASVGSRKRADTQALFSNISDIVQGAEKRHYEMKVQKIQHDFETLSNAMRGYEEAKASGNQEMMKHNADIVNTIMSDPKKSKELAKAFDVNMNPMANEGKNKKEKPNPAADAAKAAFVKDQQAYQNKQSMFSPQAQAMMRQIPQTTQVDPATMLRMQLTEKGVLPKAGEELTFTKDLMEIQQRIHNNQFTNDTREKIAKMFTDARDRSTMASLMRTAMTIQDSKDKMATIERMWANRADKTYQGIHEKNEILKDKISNSGDADVKKLNALNRGLGQTADSLNKQLEDARKAHDTQKMGEISQKLDSLQYMQQIVNANIAQKLNLNPQDFDQDQFRMDDELMKSYESLFPNPIETTGGNAADQ